jgi:hypothetical protein
MFIFIGMDTVYILCQFGARKRAAKRAYPRFAGEGMARGKVAEFTGGGLIRGRGGWSQAGYLPTAAK